MSEPPSSPFQNWGDNIDWKKRVKAVCKPCWELKYCPYGPLVEEFPLKEEPDSQSCLIFGHDCPVFSVAEPFTETKDLRNISRTIPRPVQFRVLKRENQICCVCGNSVKDEDIHFDHVIPYSKGGHSGESNVRLLCSECNLSRGNRFEAEHLVSSVREHLQSPLDLEFVELLLEAVEFAHEYKGEHGEFPRAEVLVEEFNEGEDVTHFEQSISQTFTDFHEFFTGPKPAEITKRQREALKLRWGFKDGSLYILSDVCAEHELRLPEMVILERALLCRAGWFVSDSKSSRQGWEKL